MKLEDVGNSRTPQDVAQWMFDEVMRTGVLDHQTAVHRIQTTFGREFIYENENGNPAIDPDVLTEFKKLGEPIVWSKSSRHPDRLPDFRFHFHR